MGAAATCLLLQTRWHAELLAACSSPAVLQYRVWYSLVGGWADQP